jgi:hypothetical protein
MPSGSGATTSGALRGSLVWLAAIGLWLKLLSVWLLAARLLTSSISPGRASVSTFTMTVALPFKGEAYRRLRKESHFDTPAL